MTIVTILINNVIPLSSGVGFLLWIGIMITAKSFEQDTDSNSDHSVAVALGLVPALAAWAWQLVQESIAATMEVSNQQGKHLMEDIILKLAGGGVNPSGMIALSQVRALYPLVSLVYIIKLMSVCAS